MTSSSMIVYFLVGGTINAIVIALIAFLLSRFVGDIYGRSWLVIFLFIAVGVYVGFVVGAGASMPWFYAEVVHAVVLGAMGLLGLRGSPYWIAAGWALHPIWDFVPHYLGPGHAFTPESWSISCISLDWVIALYIVIAYGVVGGHRLGFREVATT